MDEEKCHLLEDLSETFAEPAVATHKDILKAAHASNAAPSVSDHQSNGRCHSSDTMSDSEEKRLAQRKLLTACAVSLLFMTGEVVGGYASRSLAIMTDAAHLLADFGSIMISVFSLCIASRPKTKTMTFGWHRAEVLGALLSVVSIWAVTVALVFMAIQRLISDDYEIHSNIMVITSGCAVLVNILMAMILHQSSTPLAHSHRGSRDEHEARGHSHAHRRGNTSVRAAFIHVIGDLLQSFGVLLAAIVIHFWPAWKIVDPICTFLFSVMVLGSTFTIIREVYRVLMEGTPYGIQFNTVRDTLLFVRGVKATHNLHVWGLSMSHSLLSAHVVIEENADSQKVLTEASEMLQTDFGFSNITIQVEHYSGDMLCCTQWPDLQTDVVYDAICPLTETLH